MTIPNLSVIMPVYNGMPYLKEAILSLLEQSYQNFIVYIIDNGSDDGTSEYLRKIDDARINYVRLEEKNFVKSLNTGLKLVDTPFIARMDADDIIHPQRFEQQINFLNNHKVVSLVGTLGYYIGLDGKRKFKINLPLTHDKIIDSMLKVKNAIIHPSVMFRKNVVDRFGGYNGNYYPAEDYDFFLRIGNGVKFANIPERLYLMRIRKDSIISTKMKDSLEKYYLVSELYSKNYGSYESNRFKSGISKQIDSLSLVIYRKGLHLYLNLSIIVGIFYFMISSLLNPFRLFSAIQRRMQIKK